MKKMTIAAVTATFLAAGTTSAFAETSANVAVTTDYVFRGISQTDGAPAIQGGIDYEHQSGFAAGVWASSVDDTVGDAGLEIDLYASYSGVAGESGEYGYSVGFINYRYPGGDTGTDVDVSEFFIGGTYRNLGLTYYIGDSDLDADYLEFTANFDLGRGVIVGTGIGHTFDDNAEDFTDFKISIATQLEGLDVELAYTDNNIDNPTANQDSRVFLTVSKTM